MTLYKGRIGVEQSELMDRINRSLPVDIRLLPYDVLTNKAWAVQLRKIGVFSEEEYEAVIRTLNEILDMVLRDELMPLPMDEDVHTLTERLLSEKLGETGAKIHTGRSRNDQVVCDLKLYIMDQLGIISNNITKLNYTLASLSKKHAATLMAGTTHLQPAQPITLGFFLISLAFALRRDDERLGEIFYRTAECPLGSGALAGAGFAVDRAELAEELGFLSPSPNALDAVADRDFVQETANACAIICNHLSRYAEQFIIWANPAFGYIRFSDGWSTGSSMMPQKRNPDAMELIRGKTARSIGNATALMALTKGVPLSYAKDLQEDKEALFDILDTTAMCVDVFNNALKTATFFPDKMRAALTGDILATDLADELVKAKVPFRNAHEKVARLVAELETQSKSLEELNPDELASLLPELKGRNFSLRFEDAIQRRSILGGTSPDRVLEQAETFLELSKNIEKTD